jgi:hypothetical protein
VQRRGGEGDQVGGAHAAIIARWWLAAFL